jgi:hypothetical protein
MKPGLKSCLERKRDSSVSDALQLLTSHRALKL